MRKVSSGGTGKGFDLARRRGRKPPSDWRRSIMYSNSALSGSGLQYGTVSPICSSRIGMLKRSRNALICSRSIFFCWCAMFWPSPALPMPKPLMVLARMIVGPPVCFVAASYAA